MQGKIMGNPQGSGLNAPAPFLIKTYEMVDDPLTNSMVSWSQSGYSFVVWKPPEFTQYLLPSYFKHSNFSSFVRQLNTYGFRKIHPFQWEFANVDFVRGQKSLLTNIHRRKPIHSHSVQNQENFSPLTETERQELEDEIKQLNYDKAMLELKLKSYGRDKQGFEFQTQTLRERLQSMERRQMQLMPFLALLIKKLGFASFLTQHDNKKRRLFKSDCFHGEHNMEDQTSPEKFPSPLANFELIDKLDSSLKFWEDVFHEVGDNVGQEASSFRTKSWPSAENVGNLSPFSGDGEPSSTLAHPSSHNSGDMHSTPELVGWANEAERPTSSASYPDDIIRPESPEFDGNIRPGNEEIKASETTYHAMLAGANDQFWQSCLTEAPGSSVIFEGEHQSDKRTSGRTNEIMPESDGRFWYYATT